MILQHITIWNYKYMKYNKIFLKNNNINIVILILKTYIDDYRE